MRIRSKFWRFEAPASDGSIISQQVFEAYLRSPEYNEMIESGNGMGSLTHRSRDPKCNPPEIGNLKGTVGKDDSLLVVSPNMPAPIWRIEKMYAQDGWAWADMVVFDENTADPSMAEQIIRFKSLVRSGCMLGVSAVVVAYWDNQGGQDVCRRIHQIKSCDITNNPSQKGARITEIIEDDAITEKKFSNIEIKKMSSGIPVMKTFSSLTDFPEIQDLPKTSKIDFKFTSLKVKEFSCSCNISEIQEESKMEEKQKEFSVGTVKERLRYAKLSPRQQFRRLMIDYKAAMKAAGGIDKMSDLDVKTLKSLFTTDVLNIIKQIYPDIMKGKQISTLIGASSISKNARMASQKLQIPFRLAMQQQEKQHFISKDRYQKIQDAYLEFTNSLIEEVFGQKTVVEEEVVTEEPAPGFGAVSR